jgi:large subunit ribosomal protein L9
MKVIILKDTANVGQRGQLKEISDGYALNYLIPHGLAEQATAEKVKAWEARMKSEAQSMSEKDGRQKAEIAKLEGIKLSVKASANDSGHLYKQLSGKIVAEALKKDIGIDVDEKSIVIKNPIKTIGEASVEVHLGKYKAAVSIIVEAQ